MIQQFLTSGKGLTDLAIYKSPCGGQLHFNLGLALMEVVPNVPEHAQYKMALGRLVNADWSLRDLERQFGHDHRTLTRWGEALKSSDSAFVARMFAGRGPVPKITEPVAKFAAVRYKELRGTVRDYSKRIAAEVLNVFGVTLSGESLRQVFRSTGIEESAGDCWEGMDNPLAETASPAVEDSTNALSAPAPTMLHHAGQLLFAPWLDREEFGKPESLWLAQTLQGAANIEQSKTVCPESLSLLSGCPPMGIRAQHAAEGGSRQSKDIRAQHIPSRLGHIPEVLRQPARRHGHPTTGLALAWRHQELRKLNSHRVVAEGGLDGVGQVGGQTFPRRDDGKDQSELRRQDVRCANRNPRRTPALMKKTGVAPDFHDSLRALCVNQTSGCPERSVSQMERPRFPWKNKNRPGGTPALPGGNVGVPFAQSPEFWFSIFPKI
jgi:hypothetical protein